jgi:hypothetical protein
MKLSTLENLRKLKEEYSNHSLYDYVYDLSIIQGDLKDKILTEGNVRMYFPQTDFNYQKFLDKVFVKVFICSIVAIILPFVFFKYVHPTLFHNLMFSTLSIIWVGVVVVILGLDKIERSWVNEKVCNFFKKV